MGFDSIKNKIENNDPLDFGSIFSRSIELFKKVWVQGFVTLLLTMLCILPFYFIAYLPMIVGGFTDPEMLQYEEPGLPVILGLIVSIPILMIGIMAVSLALMAAFLRICKANDLNESASDDYFYFFKNGRLRKVVILAALYLGLSLLGMLACGVGIFYLTVPLSLIPAFLAFDEDLEPIEIVKLAFQLGNKNWLVIFGLIIIMGLVAQLGVILCFVGVLFTAMLSKVSVYYMYKDGVGFDRKEGEATAMEV